MKNASLLTAFRRRSSTGLRMGSVTQVSAAPSRLIAEFPQKAFARVIRSTENFSGCLKCPLQFSTVHVDVTECGKTGLTIIIKAINAC